MSIFSQAFDKLVPNEVKNPASLLSLSMPWSAPHTLWSLLGGRGGSGDSDAPTQSYPEFPAFPEMPALEKYRGSTSVDLPSGYLDIESLVNQLVTGQVGDWRTIALGDRDMELFNRAVVIPNQQNLTSRTLPQIASVYSGGAYGSGGNYNSGARRQAQANAITDNANELAGKRLEYDQLRTNNMLSALGLLPSFTNITDIRRQNDVQNLDRKINVHFKNQGLVQQGFSNAVTGANYALEIAGIKAGIDNYNKQLEYQQQLQEEAEQASLYSLLGTGLGAGLGALTGGIPGAFIGSTAGGSLGSILGGGSYNSGVSGINSILQMLALKQLIGGGSSMTGSSTSNLDRLSSDSGLDLNYLRYPWATSGVV